MNIIFVCHGSICRSPAAEYIAKSKSSKHAFHSRALSFEEIGNDIYPPMKGALKEQGIPFGKHHAEYLSKEDAAWADLILYMDASNRRLLEFHHPEALKKTRPLFDFAKGINEIEDPWYTGRYQKVVGQISECIDGLLKELEG